MPDGTATQPKLRELDDLIGGKELLKSVVQKLSSQLLLFSVAVIVFVLAAFFLFDGEALVVSLLILFVFLVGAAGYLFFEEKKSLMREDPGTMNRVLGNQVAHIVKPTSAPSSFSVELDVQKDSGTSGHGTSGQETSGHGRTGQTEPPAGARDIAVHPSNSSEPSKPRRAFHVGEKIILSFRASRDCYLTLLNIGTSGKLTVLFPNAIHPNNHVQGGTWHEIPGTSYGFEYRLQGPTGTEKLKAFATLQPIALLESSFAPDGSIFRQAESSAAARDIAVVKEKTAALPDTEWAEAYFEFQVVA